MTLTRMMIMVTRMIIFYKGEDGDVNEEEDDDGTQRVQMMLFSLPLLLPMSPHHLLCAYVCERNIVCGCVRET
jgi:hypothetical protein